jgi:hypothetical protein
MESTPDTRTAEEIHQVLMNEIPERCHACPVLGRLAVEYATGKAEGRLSGERRRWLERKMFSRTANRCIGGVTTDGACGSLDV